MTGRKAAVLALLVIVYLISAVGFQALLSAGILKKMPKTIMEFERQENESIFLDNDVGFNLHAAQDFLESRLVRENKHIDLYYTVIPGQEFSGKEQTNSEAMSYYLLWAAQEKKKGDFDLALDFIEQKMMHPEFGYMQWRLEDDDTVKGDGANIASDADLRAIKALLIAEEQWGDDRYTQLIGRLAKGLERLAITNDRMLAPYGGVSGSNSSWIANEVWISYADFTVFRELGERSSIWRNIYSNMKKAALGAQIHNGLYNSELTAQRKYGNGLDEGAYSINSLWIMVRNAESNDKELVESARKSLAFYRQKYGQDGVLYQSYDSSGNPKRKEEAPWVYALVGRAALHLGDGEFSKDMVDELLKYQELGDMELFGAIIEGDGQYRRVGQFTMQESILTMQDYLKNQVGLQIDALNNTAPNQPKN